MHSHRTARTVAALLGASAWLTAGLAQAAAADCVSPKILTESADDSSLTVVWSKSGSYHDVAAPTSWRVYNGTTKVCETSNGPTGKPNLYCHVTGLAANTQYTFTVKSYNGSSESNGVATTCSSGGSCKTQAAMSTVYLDTQSGATQNTDSTAVTTAIQNALNSQCVAGKRLVIKSGETFISGGLNVPNNCTFEIDGTLKASTSASQYSYTSDRFPLYGTGGSYGSVHYPTNYGTDIGLRFKTGTTRGGGAQNVTLRDTTVSNIQKDIIMMEGSYNDSTGMPSASQGYFTNITINNVTGTGKSGSYAIAISGNTNPMHSSFTFSNINTTGADKGISIFQTKSSSFTNVTSDKGSFYYDKTATGLTFSGCSPAPTAK